MSLKLLLISGFLVLTQQAQAGADCPEVPRDQWLSEQAMQQKIVNDYKFSISKFKIDDNCYEIYGYSYDADNPTHRRKVEVYFNPVDGSIVKQEFKD